MSIRQFETNDGQTLTIRLPDCPLCACALVVTHIGNCRTKTQRLNVKCSGCRIERTDAVSRGGINDLISYQEKAWNRAGGAHE